MKFSKKAILYPFSVFPHQNLAVFYSLHLVLSYNNKVILLVFKGEIPMCR